MLFTVNIFICKPQIYYQTLKIAQLSEGPCVVFAATIEK